MARESFGDRVDYGRVRICDGPGHNPVAWLALRNGNPAITLVNTIHSSRPIWPPISRVGGEQDAVHARNDPYLAV